MRTYIIKTSFTFALSFVLIYNVLAQTYTSSTIYTPAGSQVTAWHLTSGEMSSNYKIYLKNFWLDYYDNNIVFMSEATYSYNCHGYAWWSSQGGSDLWIGLYDDDDEDVFWEDGSYIEVPFQSWATKVSYGGPCIYYSPEWGETANWCDHSAITTGINNWFISKWGASPLFAHYQNDCPYDDGDLHYYVRPYITGPGIVCPAGAQFSIEDLPGGATITWSTSSNITRVSSQGSNPCQFESNVSGENGWIDATISYNGNYCYLSQRNVWVGSDLPDPEYIEIKGENYEFVEHTNDMWELCPNTIYRLQAHSSSTVSQWDWTIPGSWELLSDENSPEILIQTGDYIYWEDEVHVDVYNYACDTWIYNADYLLVTAPPFGCGESKQLSLYPNPATNSVEVELVSINKKNPINEYSVSIIDNTGTIYYSSKSNFTKFTLPLNNLKNGIYLVVVSDGKTRYSKTLIVNHN